MAFIPETEAANLFQANMFKKDSLVHLVMEEVSPVPNALCGQPLSVSSFPKKEI